MAIARPLLKPSGLSIKDESTNRDTGFSIVEIAISAALLIITAIGVSSIFNRVTFSLRRSSAYDAVASAISADLASIERLNNNYTCKAGTCGVTTAPPTKFDYAPDSSNQTAMASFKDLCQSGNISAKLITLIDQIPSLTTANSTAAISINRTVKPHPDNLNDTDYPRHLYIVEWKWKLPDSEKEFKRMIVLSPTVANWCP